MKTLFPVLLYVLTIGFIGLLVYCFVPDSKGKKA